MIDASKSQTEGNPGGDTLTLDREYLDEGDKQHLQAEIAEYKTKIRTMPADDVDAEWQWHNEQAKSLILAKGFADPHDFDSLKYIHYAESLHVAQRDACNRELKRRESAGTLPAARRQTSLSTELIGDIKNRNHLADVAESYGIDSKKSGNKLNMVCPFHQDTSPSLVIYPDEHFYCFGCHARGDVIEFVMRYEKLEFRDAIERLGQRVGIDVPKRIGAIYHSGNGHGPEPDSGPGSTSASAASRFFAYLPEHKYLCDATGAIWPASSVNAKFDRIDGAKASEWLDTHRTIEQMTWMPGAGQLIRNRVVSGGGWRNEPGYTCYNLYRPPEVEEGDPNDVALWIAHVEFLYKSEADHIIKWLAHRVQHPGEKINHALVLGGEQGIGKDTLLEPVRYAIGPWNFGEITPVALLGRFNKFVKSVILRISEARDLGEMNRYAFYEHSKMYIAAPPEVLPVDEKNVAEYYVPNVCGVLITSNHKADGIYLPAEDRRHFVAWSERTLEEIPPDYWTEIYSWFENGGNGNVAAYLRTLDLSGFDPKAPPPKTSAFWDIVNANRAPEDAELADVLDKMQNPNAVTLEQIKFHAGDTPEFVIWLNDRRNRKQIPHRLESCGYTVVRNDVADDGLWRVNGKRQAIYARNELSVSDRISAAGELMKQPTTRQ